MCVNVHVRQLGEWVGVAGSARVSQHGRGSGTPGYAVISRDFCKVYSYHDAISWVAPARHKCYTFT